MDKLTLLRKLAPYLPYDIDIQVQEALNQVSWLFEKAEITQLTSFTYDRIKDGSLIIKPVLYSFDKLTATILHEGKEVIPAVEVAKLALNCRDAALISVNDLSVEVEVWLDAGAVSIYEEFDVARNVNGEYEAVSNQVAIVDLLRSMHFAVGFESGEYIEKEVGNG